MIDAVDAVDVIYMICEIIEIRDRYRLNLGIKSPLFSAVNKRIL